MILQSFFSINHGYQLYIVDYIHIIPPGADQLVGFPTVASRNHIITCEEEELGPELIRSLKDEMVENNTAFYIGASEEAE